MVLYPFDYTYFKGLLDVGLSQDALVYYQQNFGQRSFNDRLAVATRLADDYAIEQIHSLTKSRPVCREAFADSMVGALCHAVVICREYEGIFSCE